MVDKVIDPPSRRLNFTFIAHPDKDQLVMFGGEFFDGQKVSLLFQTTKSHTEDFVL